MISSELNAVIPGREQREQRELRTSPESPDVLAIPSEPAGRVGAKGASLAGHRPLPWWDTAQGRLTHPSHHLLPRGRSAGESSYGILASISSSIASGGTWSRSTPPRRISFSAARIASSRDRV
ncbi:hypothetical protein [Tardiphaga sp.]|uniref:hypothetical protein n=1 Tax=Tardiphaga sp. TaxID=1926292 RepID=UPI0025D323EB|nr:hypothetical protein [Tardiphaga sp.]